MKKQILEFDSINLWFGYNHVLFGVYLKCETGKVVGLMGRNGSGKTSLMKTVFGSLEPASKSVRIDGMSLTGTYLSKKLIRYLPQHNFIPSHLTVKQALKLFGIKDHVLTELFPEFAEWLNVSPNQLSGGYRRILEIMLILKSNAAFCLLDEPFSGLMPLHIDVLKSAIIRQKELSGIIIADHLYRHVLDISDDLYLLSNGRTKRLNHKDELISMGYLPSLNFT